MTPLIFNSDGELVRQVSIDAPTLKIVWAKAFNEIYCYHANLTFSFEPDELYPNEYFKICVGIRQQTIEKGKVKNFSDKTISSHILGKYNNGKVSIPLHSVKILDSLCGYGWTSLKNGQRGATKFFPLSITVYSDNKKYFDFYFHHMADKFPFTICENEFNKLSNDDKLETTIVLR